MTNGLIIIHAVRHSSIQGNLEFDLEVNGERLPFTYTPTDMAPTTAYLTKWLAANPKFVIGPAVVREFNPVMHPLTARQFRMGLIQSKVSIKQLTTDVNALAAKDESFQIHFEYTTSYRWDDELTQRILSLAFGDIDSKMLDMWKLASTLEA